MRNFATPLITLLVGSLLMLFISRVIGIIIMLVSILWILAISYRLDANDKLSKNDHDLDD